MKKANLLMVVLMVLLLSSCKYLIFSPTRYSGDNLHLLVASRESLLGVSGHYEDEVVLIEIDPYGRVLYGFLGKTFMSDDEIMAVGIIQTFDDHEVFYYDGVNMISKTFSKPKDMELLSISDIQSSFSVDDIGTLKAANDWGLPLNPEYYFSTRIEKIKPIPIKPVALSKVYSTVSSTLTSNDCLFFVKDGNGLMLYVMQEYDDGVYGDAFLVMINKNGETIPNTGIYKLTAEQVENPWEALYQFKVNNGWAFH